MRWLSGRRLRAVEVAFTGRVEKIMSLTLSEFQGSIAPLYGERLAANLASADIAIGSGQVVITYEGLASVRFGGLLELPRARVALTFEDVAADEQARFVKRFDLAFQRGGG